MSSFYGDKTYSLLGVTNNFVPDMKTKICLFALSVSYQHKSKKNHVDAIIERVSTTSVNNTNSF